MREKNKRDGMRQRERARLGTGAGGWVLKKAHRYVHAFKLSLTFSSGVLLACLVTFIEVMGDPSTWRESSCVCACVCVCMFGCVCVSSHVKQKEFILNGLLKMR
jgi:hypothetical protein